MILGIKYPIILFLSLSGLLKNCIARTPELLFSKHNTTNPLSYGSQRSLQDKCGDDDGGVILMIILVRGRMGVHFVLEL